MDEHGSHDHTREREVIVTDSGRSSGAGGVFAAILALLVVLLIGWFLFNGFGGDGDGATNIDIPHEVDVNVNPGDGGDGGGEG